MTDPRERFRQRAETKADSICYTYKQHFAVANFYRALSRVSDGIMFGAAALLLADGFWEVIPNRLIIVPPLVIAGITGYRRGTSLDDRAQEFRRSARRYHALFDEFRDFLTITVETEDIDTVHSEFDRLSEKRRELNSSTPDASSIWYRYIKLRGRDQIMEDITTSPETREALSGRNQ